MTDEADKAGKPKPRRTGQRETIVAGKKYRLRVFLCKDAAGRKHYHGETFHGTAGQAEDRIREIIRRHRAGEAIKASADTFGALLDEFVEAKRLSVADSSLTTYKRVIEHSIRPNLGDKLLVTVDAAEIQGLYNKLHADGLRRSSVRFVHTLLGMVFKLAVKRKKLAGSPMAGVELPREWAEAEDESEDRAMDTGQVAAFMAAAVGNRFECLFKLAFNVGFRPGELLALKWADFDAEGRTLRVNQNIVWPPGGKWYLKKPKTKKSKRALPLTPALVAALKAQRTAQLEARMKAGKLWTDHGFIFADTDGEPFSPWTLYRECKRILKAAGLPDRFSPKTGRHTMASMLIAAGKSPKAVSERMGHSKITTTLQQYTHVLPGEQAELSEETERLYNAKK